MKNAFLIIAHECPTVLKSLLTQLDHQECDIYLLIDKKSEALAESFRNFSTEKAGFTLLPHSVSIHWGDISQVKAEILLFEKAFQNGPYDYYHLLSGTDQMIKPMEKLKEFLTSNKGKEFVEFWHSAEHDKDTLRKVQRYYLFTKHMKDKKSLIHKIVSPMRNVFLALQKATSFRRQLPYREMKKGSNWVSITNDFCGYLLQQKEHILRKYRHTLCPDEIFLQTTLWNSEFRKNIYAPDGSGQGALRLIDWKRGNPYVWKPADAEELRASKAFFARKFRQPADWI